MTVPGQDPAIPGGETPPNPPAAQPPAAAPAAQAPAGEPFDAERARRTIEAQREEERKLKAKLKELEPLAARARELEEAQKTDLEKAQARAEGLEKQLASAQAAHRDALVRAAIEREAHAQGAVKAETVYRLVDRSAIEIGEDGAVKGADKAVKALLEAEPYLKAQQSAPGASVPGTPKPNGQQTQRDLIDKTKEEMRASGRYGRL